MATLIPAFSSCSARMTPGERRLAQRLEDKLDADSLLWYNLPIGPKRLHPDFVILHPHHGILVLEVKDWKLDTIQAIDPQQVTLLTPTGSTTVKNPLEQARTYALAIANLLEQDPLLVQVEGKHQGNLAFPYSYGIVFSHITRNQFESQPGLQQLFPSNLVLCQDEFYESVDPLDLQQRLWNCCGYAFGEPLTSTQIDRVRWHLFPEIRIAHQLPLFADRPQPELEAIAIPDLIHVLDIQQEQLARSMGEGHRVVHGVAGSGKTLILVYRCLHLAEQLGKPILVLCFNVALAAKLRSMLHEQRMSQRVIVRHFHGWCADLLWQHRIQKPSPNQFRGEAYVNELVQRVIHGVEAGLIPAGIYGAVLIDEGHDFQPAWLKLAAQMVDPETQALLLLYDDAQTIYEKQKRQQFSFKQVGIQAQGRTTILKLNYRNTHEILAVASAFAQEVLATGATASEDEPIRVHPQSAGRHGPQPVLIRLPSFKREADYLVQRVQQFQQQGIAWNQMAIVYRARFMGEQICQQLKAAGIPVEWVNETQDSRNFRLTEQSIKLITMHSSKGLEFPIVLIPGLGFMPLQSAPPAEEAKLLYVAMTRAIDQLVMTCDRSSAFVSRLEKVLEGESPRRISGFSLP